MSRCLSVAALAVAWSCLQPVGASAQEKTFRLTVPAGSLSAALDQVRKATDSRIVYSPDQIGGTITSGLSGSFTVGEALARLLQSTSLTYKVDQRGTIVIRPKEAEPPAPAPASGRQSSGPAGIEEIIVTASKREERIKDVAGSLTALSNATMANLGVKNIGDFTAYVPGLTYVSTSPGVGQITLRGVTTGARQSTATVGTYVDDTPFTSFSRSGSGTTMVPDLDPSDIQRLEVLRGPQGTLYGAGAMGGLLKYVTTPPDTGRFEGRLGSEISATRGGGFNYSTNGMINVPLSDKVAVRASGFRRSNTGFIDDVGTGNNNENSSTVEGGRVSVLMKPTDDITVRLTSLYQHTDNQGTPSVDIDPKTRQPIYGDLTQSRALRDTVAQRFHVHNAVVNWDWNFATFTSSTSYAKVAARTTADVTGVYGPSIKLYSGLLGVPQATTPLVWLPTTIDSQKFTQEFRLASPSNRRFEWLVGAFYTREQTESHQAIEAASTSGTPLPTVLRTAYDSSAPSQYREFATFGNVNVYFTESFDVGFGLRWAANKQAASQTSTGILNNPALPTSVTTLTSASSDQSTTYRVAPRWRVTEDLSLYAAAASGYRPGGPNGAPPSASAVPGSYGPDRLWNYETGVKADLFDRKVSLDVAAFYVDWSQIQLVSSVSGFQFIANGGKASSKGVEGSLTYRPVSGWVLGANGAYTDAKLESDAPAVIGGKAGDPLPNVPKWASTLFTDYSFPAFGDWTASVGASLRYVGSRYNSYSASTTAPNMLMDAYTTVDLRAGLSNDEWAFNLFVNNLFDKRGVTSLNTTYVPYGMAARATVITPLTVGLRVTRTFR